MIKRDFVDTYYIILLCIKEVLLKKYVLSLLKKHFLFAFCKY